MMQNIHFKAPNCWINDPNGFIWYKGQYHLFYQCFPYAPQWGRMHWGHAVSKDLVNWEEKGIALYPTKTDDRSGCFSGSAWNRTEHSTYITRVSTIWRRIQKTLISVETTSFSLHR